MPKLKSAAGSFVIVVVSAIMGVPNPVFGQDVRPLAPILEPSEPIPAENEEETPVNGGVIPLPVPEASGRADAAIRSRSRAVVLPSLWTEVGAAYQPLWMGIGSAHGFGIERWSPYFAAAVIVPTISPHPVFGPWGMLSTEGWLFEFYRSLWTTTREATRMTEAAGWLQRGDHAMILGRTEEAVTAYRRVTVTVPEYALGYLALGAALAEQGDDRGAEQAFRQSLDHYPAWLTLAIDWPALFGETDRLVAAQRAAVERSRSGDPSSRFVAGMLQLFGGAPAAGRATLSGLRPDPHAEMLLARGPKVAPGD
jgi:tetratricopeptide (TPR) repeat protein